MKENGHPKVEDFISRLTRRRLKSRREALEAENAELTRRLALTPAEREREDRERLTQFYRSMAERELALGYWTLDQFTTLLSAHPDVDPSLDEQKLIRDELAGCVGRTLKPLNPFAPEKLQSFVADDLMRVAQLKKLGQISMLQPVFEAFSEQRRLRDEAPTPAPSEELASWQDMLDAICNEITLAVSRGEIERFDPSALPFSVKTLVAVLEERYVASGRGKLPVEFDTVRKHLNRRGWKSKAGYQSHAAAEKLNQILRR